MIDYLNPHHVYIDAQSAPDLSMEVKRDANIIPETVGTNGGSTRNQKNSMPRKRYKKCADEGRKLYSE